MGCAHIGKESTAVESRLVGMYEGRDVVDTEEIITLREDQSFEYDFIPFAKEGGASYHGRWKIVGDDLILIAPRESGEEEEFHLAVSYQGSEPILTYTWAALRSQHATMLIPNVFVRSRKGPDYRAILPGGKQPNQRPEHNAGAVSSSTSTPPPGVAHP